MSDVFISYAREDRSAAMVLADQLQARGYSCWWDTDLLPGNDFGQIILQQIMSAKVVFAIWSKASVASRWINAELQYSLDKGIQLFHIKIDDTELPRVFRFYQAERIHDWATDLPPILDRLDAAMGRTTAPKQDRDGEAEWRELRDKLDPDKLEHFIDSFPHSRYADLARERLAVLVWERLRTSDDVTALADFANRFSDTTAGDHARKRQQLLLSRPQPVPVLPVHSKIVVKPEKGWLGRVLSFIAPSGSRRGPSPDVFISYRREDSSDVTGRIFDRLTQRYTKARVFKDVDSMPLGVDFRSYIGDVLSNCSVCLVVMGNNWLGKGAEPARKIDDPRDYVRIEIETALQSGIPVIPVFVGLATMPPESELPITIGSLVYRHGMDVRRDPEFHTDVSRLISGIELYLGSAKPRLFSKQL